MMKEYKKFLTISFLILALLAGCSSGTGELTDDVPDIPSSESAVASGESNAAEPAEADAGALAEAPADEEPVEAEDMQEQPTEAVAEEPAAEEPDVEPEPAAEEPVVVDEPAAEDAPVAALSYKLSEQPYVSPSDAFSLNLPESWNCSESGDYRVDCHNADNTGTLMVYAIATGYELLQDDFIAMTQAEMVSAYEDLKAYTELSRSDLEGTVIIESTWREGDVYWQGIDRFVRSGPSVYYLRIASVRDVFEGYRTLFEEVVQKAELNDTVMAAAPLYEPRKEYTSRELIFTIQVPTSWTEFVDAYSIQNTIVNGFLSPDKRASVQVAIYTKGSFVSKEYKGSKTLEIMRDLYGWDLRASVDKVQPDGRELLEWTGDRKGIQGITYFDSSNFVIYIFNVLWEDSTEDIYKPVLEEIIDSFEYYE